MRSWISLTVALFLGFCAAFGAEQAPNEPKEQLQQFVVLQSERLVTPFQSLTSEQAQCAISGTSNFATMRCQAAGGTAKASYHYVTALVVDKKGNAYVVACHESLVNVWCRKFTPGVAIQGTLSNGQQSFSIADGSRFHSYQTLASANIGALPPSQPPTPSAKAPGKPGTQRQAPSAGISSTDSSGTDSDAKAQGDSSSPLSSSSSPGSCAAPAASCVSFISEPSGADIYVDAKFVGNTPSSVALPSGSHEIRVEAGDFMPWTRTLTSTAGSTVTIHAVLAKK